MALAGYAAHTLGDLPIEQASKFTSVINLKNAKEFGTAVPPTLLVARRPGDRMMQITSASGTLRPPAISWLLLEGQGTLPSVDCNPLQQGPAGPRRGPVKR